MDDEAFKRRIGTVLSGKWRIDALLGTGGMACVYAATHVRNRLQVAVKVLHPEISRDEKLRQRFLREGYVANSVKHPGVVQVFDDSNDEHEAYIVMELLTGQTLKQRWNGAGRKLPLEEVRVYVSAMLDVLVAAHAADIVHRDLKPDNVFLTDQGVLKVVDFGIARLREVQNAHEHQTNTGALLGTPAFMPPEQALGNWEEVDARADLFAVAATAWVLLTGQLVHQAKGVSELLIAAATRKARPIKSLVENLPDAVAQVIDKGLSFDKADRYPSAEAMKRAWDAAFMAARHAPTLRMVALPSPQTMVDWSMRGPGSGAAQAPPGAQQIAPSTPSHPTVPDARTPEGTTPVFDPTGAGARPPSIPSRLFTTETPVSREHVARSSSKGPLVLVLAFAVALVAVTVLVVLLVTSSKSPTSAASTAPPGSTTSSSSDARSEPAPSTLVAPREPASAVSATSPSTPSSPPSSTTSASAAPAKPPTPVPPVVRPVTPAVPPGCEDPLRPFDNKGQPCPRRK